MKTLLIVLFSLTASTTFADVRCWKPVPFSGQARHWIEVIPVEGRADAMRLLFGTGLSDGLSEITFSDLVLPPVAGEFRNAPGSAFEITFTRAKSGRFDLVTRDPASGKSSTIRNFRCE